MARSRSSDIAPQARKNGTRLMLKSRNSPMVSIVGAGTRNPMIATLFISTPQGGGQWLSSDSPKSHGQRTGVEEGDDDE